MAPIPPSTLSNEDKQLWESYLKASASASTVPEQFKADVPKYVDGHLRTDADDKNESKPLKWYELHYNGSTLRFTVDMFGKQPDSGFPVYIFLHGGGSTDPTSDPDKTSNNSDWYSNARPENKTYRASVKAKVDADKANGNDVGAIYIAARGLTVDNDKIGDTYDCHCMPNSFVLYTKLIRQLIRPNPFGDARLELIKAGSSSSSYTLSDHPLNFVDPNQIYITGFSAGGDGVYRLATSLADHFSAANMSAGHPGGVRFENLANLPFSLQVGDKDVPWWRSSHAVEIFLLLKGWNQILSENYVASCSLHKTTPGDPNSNVYEWRHNSWEYAESRPDTGKNSFTLTSSVFKQNGDELQNWLKQVRACKTDPFWNAPWSDPPGAKNPGPVFLKMIADREEVVKFYDDPTKVTSDDSVLESINTNAIKWCGEISDSTQPTKTKARVRDPNPNRVIWNLGSRPPKPEPLNSNTGWAQQRFFYWLYIRDITTVDYKDYKDTTSPLVIRADRTGNTIFVNQPYNFLGILLNEHMFDFSQPIQVVIPSKADAKPTPGQNPLPSKLDPNNCINLNKVNVKAVQKIKEDTLQARGDLNYMFSAVIWFEFQGGQWQVRVADTLLPGGASPLTVQP